MSDKDAAKNHEEERTASGFEDVIEEFQENILGLTVSSSDVMTGAIDQLQEARKKFSKFRKKYLKKVDTGFEVPDSKLTEYYKLEEELDRAILMYETLPASMLIALVSHYDYLLKKLIERVFHGVEQIIENSQRTIKISEIIQLESSEMRHFLIRREVEEMTGIGTSRWSWMEWLENQLSLKFNLTDQDRRTLTELAERRHAFVHSNGIVTKDYIATCKKFNVQLPPKLKHGDRLTIDAEYFFQSAWTLHHIGSLIGHSVWRKVHPEELRDSDISILNASAKLIKDDNFIVAYRLLDFALSLDQFSADRIKLGFVINKALALKNARLKKYAKLELKQVDWDRYKNDKDIQIAKALLEDKFDEVIRLMHEIGPDKEMRWAYSEWPLFLQFNKTRRFKNAYKAIYKRPFLVESSTLIQRDNV